MICFRFLIFVVFVLNLICVTACAPDFSGTPIRDALIFSEPVPQANSPTRLQISLFVNDNPLPIDSALFTLYEKSLSAENENCRNAKLTIRETVSHQKGSAWYLGMALGIPFWPAMPDSVTQHFDLSAMVYCNETPNTVHKNVHLHETEDSYAFWYGALRTKPIEKANILAHQKLAARLFEALHENRFTDQTLRSDFQNEKIRSDFKIHFSDY